jgi:hypothetical protein
MANQAKTLTQSKKSKLRQNEKIIEWCFENEQKETPLNCLYGTGINNWLGKETKDKTGLQDEEQPEK